MRPLLASSLQNGAGMKRLVLVLLCVAPLCAHGEPAPPPPGVDLASPPIASARHVRNGGLGLIAAGGALTVAAIATSIGYGLGGAGCAADHIFDKSSPCTREWSPVGYAALGLAIAGVPTLAAGGVLTGVGKRQLKEMLMPSVQVKQDRGSTDGLVVNLGGRF